jgi:DNA-binding FadR family transcriptional regulator
MTGPDYASGSALKMAKVGALRIPSKIAAKIGTKIVLGRLLPGSLLDGEIEASDELKVSRGAYREAIRILVAKGLVHSRPKFGTRVTDRAKWNWLDPDILSWMFAKEPPRDLLANLFELRKMVEPDAAALAAERRTSDHLKDMERSLQIMTKETLHSERGRKADWDFHATLLLASGNPFVISLSSGITAAVNWSTIFKDRTQRLERDAVPDHARVYYAISARDPDVARKSMLQLIDLAFFDATRPRPGERSE